MHTEQLPAGPQYFQSHGRYRGRRGASTLNHCVLTGNFAQRGGGALDSTLNNCTLTDNSAGSGGGAEGATLNNCLLTGNSAFIGGGAYGCTLNNCTLTGNSSAYEGGGTTGGTLNNCIVYFNTPANYYSITLNFCCTTPLPSNGAGNITNAPLVVDLAEGNLRLQTNSPCINAGRNVYATGSTDLDGNPRISGGTVDIGAYEFQNPASAISYAWLQQFGLATDGSADFADPDGDAMNDWQEWRCGTDPTDPFSLLKMLALSNSGSGVVVSWRSVSGMRYCLQRSSNLAASSAFSTLQTNIIGQAGATTYTDTDALGNGPFYYRVGVQY